jgi:glutaconyl-CoA decarboxylase
MKKYKITVNGNAYEVEVEEIGGAPSVVSVAVPAAPAAPAAPSASATPAAPAAPAAPATTAPKAAVGGAPSAGATVIESPMPGTILDVRVAPGQAVEADDVLLILEAMKMENEIVAPHAGVVDSVAVAKGASVNAGDVLASVK